MRSLHLYADPEPVRHDIADVVVLVVCSCGEGFAGVSEGRAFDNWCEHYNEHEES